MGKINNFMKVSRKKLEPDIFTHYVNNLWAAFTLLDSKEEIRILFKDLFTRTEYKMLTKRLEIARRLLEGESYESIKDGLAVANNTVTRVSNILSEKGDGLRLAHKKLTLAEEKYWVKQKQITKNIENPFLKKAHKKTLLGKVIRVGLTQLDKKISKKIKHNTAKAILNP